MPKKPTRLERAKEQRALLKRKQLRRECSDCKRAAVPGGRRCEKHRLKNQAHAYAVRAPTLDDLADLPDF